MVHARNKGKEGEREFINLFGGLWGLGENGEILLKRNLDQTREGGSDIVGCDPFVIEVKRVEKLDLNSWWKQVKRAASDELAVRAKEGKRKGEWDGDGEPAVSYREMERIPVVAFRQSRQSWKFLLPAKLLGVKSEDFMICTMETFIQYVTFICEGNER